MKLVIQIPCYNEEKSLPGTIHDLPVELPGIDEIVTVIIDDGSTDRTVEIAQELGVQHVIQMSHHGLAGAFVNGLKYCVNQLKADIIVNTDADNQYPGVCIQELIKPILDQKADIVVGCRPIQKVAHFSPLKKSLQKLGSQTVQFITGLNVPDATTGFRAYSRDAARRIKVFSDFSYTIETLIQSSRIGLKVVSIPVEVNPPVRPSRLFTTNWNYIRRQSLTMLRIWSLYSPVKLFLSFGIINLGAGSLLVLRFLYYYLISWPQPSGKVQSLILAAVFLIFGIFSLLTGVIADLLAVQRKLTEDLLNRMDDFDQNR